MAKTMFEKIMKYRLQVMNTVLTSPNKDQTAV